MALVKDAPRSETGDPPTDAGEAARRPRFRIRREAPGSGPASEAATSAAVSAAAPAPAPGGTTRDDHADAAPTSIRPPQEHQQTQGAGERIVLRRTQNTHGAGGSASERIAIRRTQQQAQQRIALRRLRIRRRGWKERILGLDIDWRVLSGRLKWIYFVGAVGALLLVVAVAWVHSVLEERWHEQAELAWVQGNKALESGDVAGAVQKYSDAIGLWPGYTVALVSRGNARVARGEYESAFGDFNAAIASDANSADAYLSRGTAHWLRGELDQAEQDFAKLADLKPDDAFSTSRYGDVLAEEGKAGAVESYYQNLYVRAPRRAFALREWLDAVEANHGTDALIATCKKMDTSAGGRLIVSEYLGRAYAKQQDHEAAIAHLREAAKGDPNDVPTDVFRLLRDESIAIRDERAALHWAEEFAKREGREFEFAQSLRANGTR